MFLGLGDFSDPVFQLIENKTGVTFTEAPRSTSFNFSPNGFRCVFGGIENRFSALYRPAYFTGDVNDDDAIYLATEWHCRDVGILYFAKRSNIHPHHGRILDDLEAFYLLPTQLRVCEYVALGSGAKSELNVVLSGEDHFQDLTTGETYAAGAISQANLPLDAMLRAFTDATLNYSCFMVCDISVFELNWNDGRNFNSSDIAKAAVNVLHPHGIKHFGLVVTEGRAGPKVCKVIQFPSVYWYEAIDDQEKFYDSMRAMLQFDID